MAVVRRSGSSEVDGGILSPFLHVPYSILLYMKAESLHTRRIGNLRRLGELHKTESILGTRYVMLNSSYEEMHKMEYL